MFDITLLFNLEYLNLTVFNKHLYTKSHVFLLIYQI